jgi:hypothetical protein
VSEGRQGRSRNGPEPFLGSETLNRLELSA